MNNFQIAIILTNIIMLKIIFDINNWKKFQINWKTKETKEIKLK